MPSDTDPRPSTNSPAQSVTSVPLAGVAGWPVSHSRSPQLHRHWLDRYGISGFYVPLSIHPDDFVQVLKTLPRAGFVGLNVTLPHKEVALSVADAVTDRAALIGAANTLIFRSDGSIHADNTDGYGFMENLRQGAPGWQPEKAPAALIGAGGAARAVVVSLLEAGVPELRIANRTRVRAEQLRAEFGTRVVVHDWAEAGVMLEGARTVINATSAGMAGKPALHLPLDMLEAGAVVTDLVYEPLDTDFLREARQRGATTIDGLGMLLHQAAPGFERWFGRKPEIDDQLREAVLG